MGEIKNTQPPSSTPGEVERLVDALIHEAKMLGSINVVRSQNDTGPLPTRPSLAAARTALLSHISTAGRSSSPTPDGVIKERGEDEHNIHFAALEIIDWMMCEGLLKHRTAEDDGLKIEGIIRSALGCERRPDGPGLSHSVSSPSVSPAAAASIPGAGCWPVKIGEETTLAKCEIGLFISEYGTLCLKSEYGNNEGRIDAYIIDSGEFFWGDPPQTIASQRASRVWPVEIEVPAPGIETGTATTEGRGPKDESPVGKAEAPASTVQPPSSQESGVGETEGWVLLPREPTQEMWCSFRNADAGHVLFHQGYRAMIAAAPRPSQREG